MTTRSTSTIHINSTRRRTARFALALALVGGVSRNLWAEPPLPSLPTMVAGSAQPGELLPYPFASQAAPESQIDHTAQTSRQMVRLLGLKARLCQRDSVNSPTLENNGVRPSHAQVSGAVVAASAAELPTQSAAANASAPINRSESQAQVAKPTPTRQPTQPTLPTLPSLPVSAAQPDHAKLCESLMDVKIPESLVLGQELDLTPPPASTSAPTSVAPEAPTEYKLAKQPELLRLSKPLSITASGKTAAHTSTNTGSTRASSKAAAQASAADQEGPVRLSLNDTTESSTPASKPARGVELHLSSGDAEGAKQLQIAAPVAARPPRPAMRVRIEGEPGNATAAKPREAIVRPAEPMPNLVASTNAPNSTLASGQMLVPALTASLIKPATATSGAAGLQPPTEVRNPAVAGSLGFVPRSGNYLSVTKQESLALNVDFTVAEMSVEHPNVCQLLRTGDRSLSIIGLQPGATRIALISYDGQGERRIEVRDVVVGESGATQVNLPELAAEMTQTVRRMFPSSDVQVMAEGDSVVVHGYINYESDAKKILVLVRKTSLAPVVDRLTTSGK